VLPLAWAQADSKELRDNTVSWEGVYPATFLTPEIAKETICKRSKGIGIVNVAFANHANGTLSPVAGQVEGPRSPRHPAKFLSGISPRNKEGSPR